MKKIKNLFWIIGFILVFSISAFAKSVDFVTADKIAVSWLNYLNTSDKIKDSKVIDYNNKHIAYLFNLSPSGFIIVPFDDILPPIKAYSLTNNYVIHGKIFPLMLEKELYTLIYSNKFSRLAFGNNKKIWDMLLNGNTFSSTSQVGPLLTTTWDQAPYYNEKMPVCSNCSSEANGHYLVGCVGTALGQIMKYNQWPDQGRGSNSYTDSSSGVYRSANFENSKYDWSLMPNMLDSTSSQSVIDEVASLLSDITIAVEAKCESSATSASDFSAADALYKYFKYMPTQYVQRTDFSSDDNWFNIFKLDLDNKRVSLLGLDSSSLGGHAVVVDGYKIDGSLKQLHLNMGWSGNDTSWYALNNIVTSQADFDNVLGQDGVVGITKDTKTDYLYYYDDDSSEYTYGTIGYGQNEDYGAVKFEPDSSGYLSHVAFYIASPDVSYEVWIYESSSDINSALSTTPIFSASGTATTTGWHYVEPTNANISISSDKNYFVEIKFSKSSSESVLLIPVDPDGSGTGNSYIGNSKYSLQQRSDFDILIRMGISSTSSSSNGGSTNYSNAYPSTPLDAELYQEGSSTINPADNLVSIKAASNVYLQPSLQVDTSDIGQIATLVMYIYIESAGIGIMMPSKQVTLSSVQQFNNVQKALDFSSSVGLDFYVFYGYVIGNNLKYNAYEVKVE